MILSTKTKAAILIFLSLGFSLLVFQNAILIDPNTGAEISKPDYIPSPFKMKLKIKLPAGIQDLNPNDTPYLALRLNGDISGNYIGCIPLFSKPTGLLDPYKKSSTSTAPPIERLKRKKTCGDKVLSATWIKDQNNEVSIDVAQIDFGTIAKPATYDLAGNELTPAKSILDVVSELTPNTTMHRNDDGMYVGESTSSSNFVILLQFVMYTTADTIAKDTKLADGTPAPNTPNEENPLFIEHSLTYDNGNSLTETAVLIGKTLGFMSKDGLNSHTPVMSFKKRNEDYWQKVRQQTDGMELLTPRNIVVSDRFVSDDNLSTLNDGIENLAKLGNNTVGLDANSLGFTKTFKKIINSNNIFNVELNAYNSMDCAFTFDDLCGNNLNLDKQVGKKIDDVRALGYSDSQIKMVRLFDEPRWSFPYFLDILKKGSTEAPFTPFYCRGIDADTTGLCNQWIPAEQVSKNLQAYKKYLNAHLNEVANTSSINLNISRIYGPADVMGPHGSGERWKREAYYWTQRYFSHDAGVSYKRTNDYLINAKGLRSPNSANLSNIDNDFVNIKFTPRNPDNTGKAVFVGPNNTLIKYPALVRANDMGFGGYDYFQMARDNHMSYVWSEDWLPQSSANYSTYQSSMLRSAARYVQDKFGSIVVGRSSNHNVGKTSDGKPKQGEISREMRYIQRAMAPIANGSKYIFHYLFGPEYAFPQNSYSDNNGEIFKAVAYTNTLIAKSEDVLFPGRSATNAVGILLPRSSYIWSNRQFNGYTKAKANDVALNEHKYFFALLQHANIPVDFIDEDKSRNLQELKNFKVIYVPGHSIPKRAQENLISWVKDGGTLVLSPGAGSYDEYDMPTNKFEAAAGITRVHPERSLNSGVITINGAKVFIDPGAKTDMLIKSNIATQVDFYPAKVLPREEVTLSKGSNAEVLANYISKTTGSKDAPAIVRNRLGLGSVYYYSLFLGYNYNQTAAGDNKVATGYDLIDQKYSKVQRNWFILPIKNSGYEPPVEIKSVDNLTDWHIETPVLYDVDPNSSSKPLESMALTVFDWRNNGRFDDTPAKVTMRIRLPSKIYSVDRVIRASDNVPVAFTVDQDDRYFHITTDIKNIDVIKIYLRKD